MASATLDRAAAREGGAQLRGFAVACAVGAVAVLVGGAVAYGYAAPMAVAVVAGTGLWLGWRHLPYVVPALLLMLALNGIPGLDLAQYAVPGSFRPEDVFVIALIVLAAGRMLLAPSRGLPRLQQYLWIWALVFGLVWLLALGQAMDSGTPWLDAALFGRDFLYFAALAPLAGYLFANREHGRRVALIVAGWTGLFSLLLILAQLRLIDPSIVNPHLTNEVGPLLRIYTPMLNVVVLTFSLSLAYVLLEAGPGRRWAALLTLLTGLACVLSLTRALYVGVAVGIVISAIVWAMRGGASGQRLRRRLAMTALTLGVVGAIGLVASPGAVDSGPVSTVSVRVESGVTELTDSGAVKSRSTLAGRKYRAGEMLRYLGDRWPLGLGFVPPSARYVPGLPNGSIRNPDLGVLNGVMTMGVLGSALLYVPILLMLGMAIKRSGESGARWHFVPLGLMFWVLTAATISITLAVFSSTAGLTLTALVLGFAGWFLSPTGATANEGRFAPRRAGSSPRRIRALPPGARTRPG